MMSDKEKSNQEDSSSSSWPQNPPYVEREGDKMKVWGILLFGLIGATATTYAVGQLRRSVDWFYTEMTRLKGTTGGSYRSSFRVEAWKRYNRRMQEEYEDEMERVERIRRMQSVFNRERNKYKRSYQSWGENGPGAYHQHFQRNDWYWKTEASHREQRTNSRATPQDTGNHSLSHHYSVLGLDRWRSKPYTETEIKVAFRAKAMQCHPDQNQDNKEAAEAKFKEVLTSYEAIKSERKSGTH
ncbi:hypothetical protein NE237_018671 [Protea cynaroides]|uniref:J domain-containing protein n=1 Tax=Protea cynaroides TaxID=273540 RepID=A0A9Q0QP76_9MAGN|nr:hypothetical protein NE237_018671 [Protea cynaroides]